MSILDLLDEASQDVTFFENHPVNLLSLEEKMLYLQMLALIMNADNNIELEQKNYLALLGRSFDFEVEVLNQAIEFSKNPDKNMALLV